jgi:signal transduction histidine kinase
MTSTGIGATTFEDSAGHVWFGDAHDRVYRIDDPRAVTMRPVPVVFSRDSKMWAVGEIAEQPAGQLWMSSSGRVARLTGGGISIVELGMAQPRALFADSRGWLWIGTRADGVLVTRNSGAAAPAFERYGVEQGLASNSVVAIAEDASGRIYLGTSRGLNRLDVATGRVRHYGTKDGLAGPRVTDCLRDRAGRIWISTSTGLSLLVPEPPSTHADPGQVLFTRVRAGGEDLAISERGTSRLPGLSLDPARPELTVEVVVPGTRGLRYEYRLRDSEDRWSPVPDDRLLTLPRLSSGQYSLSVRAASSDGDSYGAPATLRFEVLRPLWARWWFIASASGVAGLVLFGAHRLRVRQILAVERIRRQVALDLHDEMGAGLAQIAVLNEVAKRDAVGAVSGLLTESAGVARELRESMSDIVWAVDPRRDTLADLVQRMRQAAFDVLQRQGLRVSFSAPDDRVLAGVALAPDRRKHLLLMLKEAITNIARHAGASSVDIALSLEHKRIRLRVADDGRGFDPAVASDGNGLRSFQTRAAEIGGEATVRSSPGAGTTLDVTAPLA